MPSELSVEHARLLRLGAQSLGDGGDTGTTVTDVVEGCCGLQAQDSRQAPLSISARSHEVTASDVARARFDDRSIVRTWCMRGTLHFVAAEDLPWLLSLFGPLYVDRGQRRLADLGLDEDACERAMELIRDAFATGGPLTRDEVATLLLDEGFTFDPDGQAPVHVVRRACLEGIAVEAEPRDGDETYALLDDWVSQPPAPDREDALAELARRYVTAFEPATPDDLYAWSGLYKRDVRTGWEAIEDDLIPVTVDGEQAWTLSEPDAVDIDGPPIVRLLPMYDNFYLGHEDRDLVLPDEYADRVYPGGGVIRASVVVDGLAAGTWMLDRSRATPTVVVAPFGTLEPAVETGIEDQVEKLGRFLGTDLTLRFDGTE